MPVNWPPVEEQLASAAPSQNTFNQTTAVDRRKKKEVVRSHLAASGATASTRDEPLGSAGGGAI